VWTFAVLSLAETFGGRLIQWFNVYQHAGLFLLIAGVALIALWRLRQGFCRK
jgi:hypothetical protein